MANHDEFVEMLSRCTRTQLKQLGAQLNSNLPINVPGFDLSGYSIRCISNNNSKIYKVVKQGEVEPFILKLEKWSMDKQIKQRFEQNPQLSSALAPLYFNKSCTIKNSSSGESHKMNIQVQPFCKGGTLESAAIMPMSPKQKIDSAIMLYQQVAKFYRALEQENILFPDGKPSNFTLNERNELQLTDMKTYVEATDDELEYCAQIDTPDYPLYIPIPPPRELNKVHARHFGMNLYAYLTGWQMKNFYITRTCTPKPTSAYSFSDPIFNSLEGTLLASLIQKMISDDPQKRPTIEDAQKKLTQISQIREIQRDTSHSNKELIIAVHNALSDKQKPELLKLINPDVINGLVRDRLIKPNDALKAFPKDQKLIITAYDISSDDQKSNLLKLVDVNTIKRLVSDGHIKPNDAFKAFPQEKSLIILVYEAISNEQKTEFFNLMDLNVVEELVSNGIIKPDDAVNAFPNDQAIIINAYRATSDQQKVELLKRAHAFTVELLVGNHNVEPFDAVKAFPQDQSLILTAYETVSDEQKPELLKLINPDIVKILVSNGEITLEDASKAFPLDRRITDTDTVTQEFKNRLQEFKTKPDELDNPSNNNPKSSK